jgi:surface polysaccharide O-acyltransferase-like enzyme
MKQNQTLNLIKVISMVGVVSNHLFYPVFSRTDFYLGTAWWISLVFYTLSLISVPLFIIVNGYLLIDKKQKTKISYSKTIKRILIPAAFWLTFYYFWRYFFRSSKAYQDALLVIASGSWHHYYFLIALAGLQFLLPVFKFLAKKRKEVKLEFFKVALIIGVVLHIIEYLIDIPGSINNIFSWWMPFAAYFWFGYLYKRVLKFKANQARNLFFIWTILNLLISYLGMNIKHSNTLLGWHDSGIFYWHAFLSPNIIIMSIAFFIWMMKSKAITNFMSLPRVSKTISFLASISYGVYLIHFFVIDWVDIKLNYAIEFVSTSLSSFIVQRTLLVFVISYAISFIITRIPFTKWMVGEDRVVKEN